jgi:DNA-binding FadR family transcriptional regulator
MLNRPDQPERDVAADRLRELVLDEQYAPGDRLPPERDLIELIGVGRSALRRGLDHLEREGLIWRHVGKGTFVANGAANTNAIQGGSDPFVGIGTQLTPFRLMRARITIEPAIAREATVNASRDAVAQIRGALERGRAAASWAEYERQDDLFHRAVAEAADNALLLVLFDGLNRVRRDISMGAVTRDTSRPPADHPSFAQHDEIAEAIENREPEQANKAMRRHLQSVASRLFGES